MPLWRTYYHFVWATTQRQPLISEEVALTLYDYIIGKATALGCVTHAIGGVEDHIHLLASIPPHLSLAQFVKHIKGSSARYLNAGPMKEGVKFSWQRGYGVLLAVESATGTHDGLHLEPEMAPPGRDADCSV